MLDLLCSVVLVILNSSNEHHIGAAVLIPGRFLLTFCSQMQHLFEGGTYNRGGACSSKYGSLKIN